MAWGLPDTSERLNYADTIETQWTTALGKGRVLFSDMGRVMVSIVEDSRGAHDGIGGGSAPSTVAARGGDSPRRNTRDNLRLAAGKLGLSPRGVPPCISFFAPLVADPDGRLRRSGGRRRTDDFVDLRAEMDALCVASNGPQIDNPCNGFNPTPIRVLIWDRGD